MSELVHCLCLYFRHMKLLYMPLCVALQMYWSSLFKGGFLRLGTCLQSAQLRLIPRVAPLDLNS